MRRRSPSIRHQIIIAARQLFLEHGYVATTVDAIAAQAGLTKRTIYGYFPDKRALFRGVIEDAVGEPWKLPLPIEGIATAHGLTTALQTIAQGVNGIITQPGYVQLLRIIIAEIPAQPELGDIFEHGVAQRSLRLVTSLLQTAKTHGLIHTNDPRALARQFIGGLVIHLLLDGLFQPSPRLPNRSHAELEQYAEDFVHRIQEGAP
jgi:TetR/AcrR family transcriptional repressor of mexJK operon